MIDTLPRNLERGTGKRQPLYEQIGNALKKKIDDRLLKTGDRLPSASKLTKHFNVDYVTVNNALRSLEKTGYIKNEPRNRAGAVVVKRIEKLSFLSIRWDHRSQSINISEGIKRFCSEENIGCTLSYANSSHFRVLDTLNNNLDGYSGILLTPNECFEYKNAIISAVNSGKKIILIDQYIENVPASCVSMDHASAAYKLCYHMLKRNNPVWYFGYTNFPSSCRERLFGWKSAMEDFGYTHAEDYIWDLSKVNYISKCETDSENSNKPVMRVKTAAIDFFEKNINKGIRSIICHADGVAQGVYLAAEKIGLNVGKDIFIAGFGNTPMCTRMPVPLTSIEQYDSMVGYQAAKRLFEEINNPDLSPEHILMPYDLCVRESA